MSSANTRDLVPKEEEEELVILPARGRHPLSPRANPRREVQSSHSQPTASTSASIHTFTSKSSRALEDEANNKSVPSETMDDDEELVDDAEHQSSRFYFEDNHCLFRVETTVFRVHGFMFERASEKARCLLDRAGPDGVIVLDRFTAVDFERFLTVLYSHVTEPPELATRKEWASVLKVAHRYKFSAIRTLAISHLYLLTTPVEKIVLARRREQLPNEEVARLKYDTFVKIARAREALRASGAEEKATQMAIIQDIFGLVPEKPPADEAVKLEDVRERVKRKRDQLATDDWHDDPRDGSPARKRA